MINLQNLHEPKLSQKKYYREDSPGSPGQANRYNY
jgi:hypothetical protein